MNKADLKNVINFVLILIFFAVLYLFWQALNIQRDVAQIQSTPFPSFELTEVQHPQKKYTAKDLKGQPKVIHVWASWCGICIKEHVQWVNISKKWPVPIIGVIYRDDVSHIQKILKEQGSPYRFVLNDYSGKLGLALGLVGTPETFITDKEGVIRYHYSGGMDEALFESEIWPVIEQLNHE